MFRIFWVPIGVWFSEASAPARFRAYGSPRLRFLFLDLGGDGRADDHRSDHDDRSNGQFRLNEQANRDRCLHARHILLGHRTLMVHISELGS
jgi:hypothetical protein